MVRGDTASDSRVAGSADHRGIPLDLGASLPGARQRPRLWTRLHVSGEGDGYPRSTDLSWVAVAEWLCRTSDRHTAPRVLGSNTHLRRGAPAASSFRLCGVLQSSTHPLGIRERCAFASSGPTIWRHCHHLHPGWTAPPIRGCVSGTMELRSLIRSCCRRGKNGARREVCCALAGLDAERPVRVRS